MVRELRDDRMTSKERMLASLRLEEADRIPIAPRGIDPYTSYRENWMLEDPSYKPLIDYAKKHFDIWHYWRPKILSKNVFLSASEKAESKTETCREGEYEIRRRVVKTPRGNLIEIYKRRIGFPFRRVKAFIETDEDLEKFMSVPYEPLRIDVTPFFEDKKKVGDAGVMITVIPEPLSQVVTLFRYENFVRKAITDRDAIITLIDLMYERCLDYLTQILEAGAREVFEISGPEYVAPPMFHPRFFKDFVVKYDSELIKLIHEYDGIVYLHCHGKVNAILEMIADMKADSLHPIEPPPMGDTPLREAKRRIGDKVCLIGNIQIGDILSASKEEIDRLTRQAICEGGPDGFILSTSASPHWSPLPKKALENYIQLTETAMYYGRLPRRI